MTVSAADLSNLQYQIRTGSANQSGGISQSVGSVNMGQHHEPQEATKKRELRLLKNRLVLECDVLC